MKYLTYCAVAAALAATGCSTVPERDDQLESARAAVSSAAANPRIVALAPTELNDAQSSFARAENAWRNRDGDGVVDHLAYLAQQRAAIANTTAEQRAAEAEVANATRERERVQLAMRTQQADAARRAAEDARSQATQAQRDAAAARASAATMQQQAAHDQAAAVEAQRQAESARLSAQQSLDALAQSRQQGEQVAAALATAQDDTARERERAARLERELADLQARQTSRGMVVTMGDVLFDTGRAELKPGGTRVVDKLAGFMRDNPDRRFDIGGFTDSVGDERSNQELSERRAIAVKRALVDRGIDSARIDARGYGEEYPIASNDNLAGRQLNRRVEIVISGPNGMKSAGR